MSKKKFYGKGIPGLNAEDLTGRLIVIEGSDGSGRSTQARLLRDWLELMGYPTTEVGLKRSQLVGEELQAALEGNTLCPLTFSLFYATDFADQLEKNIIPALRAGFVVVADRYIYTLMARNIVRGADPEWLRSVYGMALIPDMIFHLKVPPRVLAERSFQKQGKLDYWESGMDISRSGDIYQCFVKYQTLIQHEFQLMERLYGLEVVNGNRDPYIVHKEIQNKMAKVLGPQTSRANKHRYNHL